jgi:hypothetical protein
VRALSALQSFVVWRVAGWREQCELRVVKNVGWWGRVIMGRMVVMRIGLGGDGKGVLEEITGGMQHAPS